MGGKHLMITGIALLLCLFSATGQEEHPTADSLPPRLLVGIKESPPFVFQDEAGKWRGISIWLWEQLAGEMGYQYKYEERTLEGLLTGLEQDSLSLCVNPLTVTSGRIERIGFTQPFFVSSSAIATARQGGITSFLAFVRQFFSINFMRAVLLLFVVIFAFGFAAWLFERHKNPEEFPGGWRGLWEGIWWSAVTMTTVGYGDKSPKSTGGRIIGLVWMFTAIIIISGFTASITSSLTINQLGSGIEDLSELREAEVGTVEASASESFLRNNYIRPATFPTLEVGLEGIRQEEVEAFVYDEPILRYAILRDSLEEAIEVLPFRFNTQYYSFGLPKDSPLAEEINPALLRIIESNQWKVVLGEYELREL